MDYGLWTARWTAPSARRGQARLPRLDGARLARRGQALLELAIFGTMLLTLMGVLINFGLSSDFSQSTMMEAFRKALSSAAQSQQPDKPTSTTHVLIYDKHIPNPSDPFGKGSVVPVTASDLVVRNYKLRETPDWKKTSESDWGRAEGELSRVRILMKGQKANGEIDCNTDMNDGLGCTTQGFRQEPGITGWIQAEDGEGKLIIPDKWVNDPDHLGQVDRYEEIYGFGNVGRGEVWLPNPPVNAPHCTGGEYWPGRCTGGTLLGTTYYVGLCGGGRYQPGTCTNPPPSSFTDGGYRHSGCSNCGYAYCTGGTASVGTLPNGTHYWIYTGGYCRGGGGFYSDVEGIRTRIIDSCEGQIIDYNACVRQARVIVDKDVCETECQKGRRLDSSDNQPSCHDVCQQDMSIPWYAQDFTCSDGSPPPCSTHQYYFPHLVELFSGINNLGPQPGQTTTAEEHDTLTKHETALTDTPNPSVKTTDTTDWRWVTSRHVLFVPWHNPDLPRDANVYPTNTITSVCEDGKCRDNVQNQKIWDTPW